jgi:hypothetical protein
MLFDAVTAAACRPTSLIAAYQPDRLLAQGNCPDIRWWHKPLAPFFFCFTRPSPDELPYPADGETKPNI